MKTKYEIMGIGFDNEPINVYDEFEPILVGEELILASKKTFHHEEEGLTFDYKYVIDCCYCDDKTYYILDLVVLPQSCCKKYIDSVIEWTGVDNIDDISLSDMESTGGSAITFGSYDEDVDGDDYEWNVDALNKIASVYKTMDALRGFYLDKAWNMIGTTGWDILNHCVNDEKLFKI